MKETVTNYYCDVCNKQVEKGNLDNIRIPITGWNCDGRSSYIFYRHLEICNECEKALREIIKTHFAEIEDCYGIRVKLKYKEK